MDANELSPTPVAKPYENFFQRKRFFAFLTVAITSFCALCFFSALSISEFETSSFLNVSGQADQPESILQDMIANEITDENLRSHLEAAFQNSDIVNQELDGVDFQAVRESLDFRIGKRHENTFQLTTAFRGDGNEVEKNLTRSITRKLAEHLGSRETTLQAQKHLGDQHAKIIDTVRINASELHDQLNATNEIVNRLNQDLSDMHVSIESLPPLDNPAVQHAGSTAQSQVQQLIRELSSQLSAIGNIESEVELQTLQNSIANINQRLIQLQLPIVNTTNSSVRIVNASIPRTHSGVSEILDSLNALDVDSIQSQLGQIKDHSRADSTRLQAELAEMQRLTERLEGSRFTVSCIGDAKTRPANGVPLRRQLFLFGLLASVLAFGTMMIYKPELEGLGFESTAHTSETLALPVITNVGAVDPNTLEEPPTAMGNSIVRVCEIALFGFFLLVAILCLVQPELRQAFFENPLYGLSKMARLFF